MKRENYPVMLRVDPHIMEIMDVSRSKAYEFIHQEKLAVKINGHSIRVPRWALFQWIEEQVGMERKNKDLKSQKLKDLQKLD